MHMLSMSQEVKAIKFGQLIECNMKNIYLKNHTQNMTEKLFPNRNWTRTHNHLVRKRTLNHLAKLAEFFLKMIVLCCEYLSARCI